MKAIPVSWSLQKKIKKRKPKLLEMIFALHFFLGGGVKTGDVVIMSDTTDESDNLDWVRVLDGRGIFHCRMEFIKFLCAMEVVVNGETIQGDEAAMKAGFKEKLAFEVHQMKMCSSGGPTYMMLPMWAVILKHCPSPT